MATPAAAGELARGPGEANKHGPCDRQRAGARLLSLAVQAFALAVFFLFAAASALLLLVLVLAARASRHRGGSRYRVPSLDPAPSPPPPLRAGLSPADIRRLPSFTFSFHSSSPRANGNGDDEAACSSPSCSCACACAVCLEAARAGERWRAMPACAHAFHAACVDPWLARTPACPVCRAAVVIPVPMSEG